MLHKKTGFGLTRIKKRRGGFIRGRNPEMQPTHTAGNQLREPIAPASIPDHESPAPPHTALDTISPKIVPHRLDVSLSSAVTGPLLEQTNQLCLFSEEGVMAVGGGHLAIIGGHSGSAEGTGKGTHRFRRKQPVGTDP